MAHLRLFDVVFTENYSIQEKLIYLETCDNLGTFVGEELKNVNNVTKKIKELLSSSSSRVEGLALLHTVLCQCSTDVFSTEAVAWLQLCTKIIQSNEAPADVKKLCASVLCQLLQFVSSYSNLCQKVPASVISPVIESILKISMEDDWKTEALYLLVACMTYFPGPCGNLKIDIEKFVLKYIYNWSDNLVGIASQCVALLPLTGGGGNLGLSHSSSWFEQFSSILSAMNQLLEYFDDQSKLDEFETMVLSSVDIPDLPVSDPLKSLFYAYRLYKFLGSCLCKMLKTHVPVNVKVPVNAVLSHICQSLAMRTPLREQINLDNITASSLLPSEHIVSLEILESLILCCGDILIPNASLISNVLLQTLEYSTDEDESENSNTSYFYNNLRKSVYKVLQTFIRKLGSNSLVHESISSFYSQIYLDIKPSKKAPNFNDTSSGSNAKKRRRMMIDGNLEDLYSEDNHKLKYPDCDWETVKESLSALKTILYSSGPLIKDDLHRDIGKTIVTLLLKIQQNSENIPLPYSNALCRRELYRVLLALVVCPNSTCPPPYQPAVRIFSVGQRDVVEIVSESCMEALSVSGSLSHPVVAPLQFCNPVEVQGSYASEGEETASNEVESDYQDERDSIMEEEDEDYNEEYPAPESSVDDVEEMKKKPQPKAPTRPVKPSLNIPHKSVVQQQHVPVATERQLQRNNEIVLVDEDERKNVAIRNRITTPLRPTPLEERRPAPASVQLQLSRKTPQPAGVTPLDPSRNSQQPRPKSVVQNSIGIKGPKHLEEVIDEDIVEMDPEDSEVEEDYEEDEDEEEDGHYRRGESVEGYYSHEEDFENDEDINDRDEEDEDSFRRSVYGDYTVEKQDIARKGSQVPTIQKSISNSNNAVTTVNISTLNQNQHHQQQPQQRNIVKTSSGVMRMEDCGVGDQKEKPPADANLIQVSSIKAVEVNSSQGPPPTLPKKGDGSGPLQKNEVIIPKTNDFVVTVINEQNHVIVTENPSPALTKDSMDVHVVDISISPVKDRIGLEQRQVELEAESAMSPPTETENKPILISSIEGNTAVFALDNTEEHVIVENNIAQTVKPLKSPETHQSPTSTHQYVVLNQKSPQPEPVEVKTYTYDDVEECVEPLVDDEDKQSVDDMMGEPEAKKICIAAIEEKDVDSMLKDFKPCLKDD